MALRNCARPVGVSPGALAVGVHAAMSDEVAALSEESSATRHVEIDEARIMAISDRGLDNCVCS